MTDDYGKTADRMWQDAHLLQREKAYRSASYLAGYVVECTLKVLLEKANGTAPQIHDLQSLQDLVEALTLNGNAITTRYGNPARFAPTMLTQLSPPSRRRNGQLQHHCDWDPFHRYDGSRWDEKKCEKYLLEADNSYDIILALTNDGVL